MVMLDMMPLRYILSRFINNSHDPWMNRNTPVTMNGPNISIHCHDNNEPLGGFRGVRSRIVYGSKSVGPFIATGAFFLFIHGALVMIDETGMEVDGVW